MALFQRFISASATLKLSRILFILSIGLYSILRYMQTKVQVGKIRIQQEKMRGWLVGQFMPDGSYKDENVEIYYKSFPVGKVDDKPHYHPKGKEYLVVVSGRVRMQIGDEVVELITGDYVAIPGGVADCLIEVLEPLTIMGVRYPSVEENKVMVES